MDVIQLHYFRTIVEQGSFNKAAEVLYMSRQGLAKIIRKMERELGRGYLTLPVPASWRRCSLKRCMSVRKTTSVFIRTF